MPDKCLQNRSRICRKQHGDCFLFVGTKDIIQAANDGNPQLHDRMDDQTHKYQPTTNNPLTFSGEKLQPYAIDTNE
jgi:hypothetical protein